MESLHDLLSAYSAKEPEEMTIIKQYIADEFKATASVAFQGEKAIVVTVPSAALANTLRFHAARLKTACNTDKKFLFRIG
jgi:hypothetical protein